MFVLKAALAVLLLALPSPAQTIQLQDGAFRVSGWTPDSSLSTEDLASILTVYTGDPDAPPMIGKSSMEDGAVVFRPRFPLAAGIRYRAVFQPPGGSSIEAVFDGPKKDLSVTTRVEHVYPSTDRLPANQLKLYIEFSGPMSRGEAWKRIHLLDEAGLTIELPFVEIEQELWDPAYRRLTVLFDPGRIKRGLVPTTEVGPPIIAGKQYTLVIDRAWVDARGNSLQEEFRKPFWGVVDDRTPLDPKQWRLIAPKAGTSDPLVVDFPEPMDYALLHRVLAVPGVTGTVSVDRNETQWRFQPNQPWEPGDYQVVVDIALEDLAGNRVDRTFDVDTFDKGPDPITTDNVVLPFHVNR